MQVKKKSQKQEKSVAKDLNARTVVASGALWGSKGDVRHDNLLVECKTTDKPFYSLTLKVWNKIDKEATKDGLRLPVMCIDINGGKERFAVFINKHFEHYKLYNEIQKGEFISSTNKSFRVDSPKMVLLYDKRCDLCVSECNTCFIVTPWEDFVGMIERGE